MSSVQGASDRPLFQHLVARRISYYHLQAPAEENLRALQAAQDFLQQALSRLESVEDTGIAGTYDLTARHHLLSALAHVAQGVNALQRRLTESREPRP